MQPKVALALFALLLVAWPAMGQVKIVRVSRQQLQKAQKLASQLRLAKLLPVTVSVVKPQAGGQQKPQQSNQQLPTAQREQPTLPQLPQVQLQTPQLQQAVQQALQSMPQAVHPVQQAAQQLMADTQPAQLQSMPAKIAQAQPKQQAPKKGPETYATCEEATLKVPGYTYVMQALQQCPELKAMQQDPNAEMTFFIPSDRAIKNLAASAHLPVQLLSSSKFKGIMCNVLRYHVVDGVHLKKDWAVGQKFATKYQNIELTVTAVGQKPQIATKTGVQANIKRVVFCGKSIVFGTDAVLTPFKVPTIGH